MYFRIINFEKFNILNFINNTKILLFDFYKYILIYKKNITIDIIEYFFINQFLHWLIIIPFNIDFNNRLEKICAIGTLRTEFFKYIDNHKYFYNRGR